MQGPILSATTKAPPVPAEPSAYVWGIATIAALGGLLFGYDWVVIGGARQFYELYFHLNSPTLIGWANSCALVGCLAGSLVAGYCSDRFGRKRALLFAAILFAVSSALTGWAHSFSSFILWRIVGGTAIGLSSNVSPLYIAEISPAAIRGSLVSLNQFAIVVGILLAQVVNWCIARPVPAGMTAFASLHSWNVEYGWRWMFMALVVPALILLFASLSIPESPRWLLMRQQHVAALGILERIGGKAYAAAEIAGIEKMLQREGAGNEESLASGLSVRGPSWRELWRPGFRRIVLIGMALAVLQQWTGINTLFNYAAEVYQGAGYGANAIFLNIVITGAINLVFTVLAMLLVDRLGRRAMMIFGCLGIGVSHLLCAYAYRAHWHGYAVLALTLCAIACYALTLAPVTWVLIAEIFPNRIRSLGVSAAVSALWVAAFLLTYSFPFLNRSFGTANIFVGYGLICLLGCAGVIWFVPETSGRSLEEIDAGMEVDQPRQRA